MKLNMRKISARSVALVAQRDLMLKYIRVKLDEEDFHGVADAAMDLRDIDSELKGIKEYLNANDMS